MANVVSWIFLILFFFFFTKEKRKLCWYCRVQWNLLTFWLKDLNFTFRLLFLCFLSSGNMGLVFLWIYAKKKLKRFLFGWTWYNFVGYSFRRNFYETQRNGIMGILFVLHSCPIFCIKIAVPPPLSMPRMLHQELFLFLFIPIIDYYEVFTSVAWL